MSGADRWPRALPASCAEAPIVIDPGSVNCKVGFAGDDRPRILKSIVGRPKYSGFIPSMHPPVFTGQEAISRRGILKLKYPVEHGMVVNWRDFELILKMSFGERGVGLAEDTPDRPVMVLEPPLNPMNNREKLCEILFERFEAPALAFSNGDALGLFADCYEMGWASEAARATPACSGTVVSIGDGVTHTTPIIGGRVDVTSVMRMNLAGRDMSDYMVKLLSERGYELYNSADVEFIRKEIIPKHLYVAQSYEDELSFYEKSSEKEITVQAPDDPRPMTTFGSERFRTPEILFRPKFIGSSLSGISWMTYDTIMKYKPGTPARKGAFLKTRKRLFSNIVLIGGVSQIPGLAERLEKEITEMAPHGMRVSVRVAKDPLTAAWRGASIAASTRGAKIWITQEMYDEYGATIIHPSGLMEKGDRMKEGERISWDTHRYLNTPIVDVGWRLSVKDHKAVVERIGFAAKACEGRMCRVVVVGRSPLRCFKWSM